MLLRAQRLDHARGSGKLSMVPLTIIDSKRVAIVSLLAREGECCSRIQSAGYEDHGFFYFHVATLNWSSATRRAFRLAFLFVFLFGFLFVFLLTTRIAPQNFVQLNLHAHRQLIAQYPFCKGCGG